MTVSLFLALLTGGALIAGLLTEAVKTYCQNNNRDYSANLIALGVSIFVGGFGTCTAYVLMNIPFNSSNILCMLLMMIAMWVGSMVGYDKVIQTINQFFTKGGE